MNHLMNTDPDQMQSNAAGPVDIYRRIHKALRACICDTLMRLGRLDCGDAQEVSAVLAQVRSMAAFCVGHLEHENRHVHTAMESRFPGSSKPSSREHEHHATACRKIIGLAAVAEQARAIDREALVAKLYRDVALFLADNLVHMHAEETENNTMLWATHTDEELLAIERAIVGSLTPDEKKVSMRWMIPAMHPHERIEMLEGMRRSAPPHVFDGMLESLKPLLLAQDWHKLMAGLRGAGRLAA